MKREVLAVFKQVMHGGYVGGVSTKIFVRQSAKNLKINFRFDRIDCESSTQSNNTSNNKAFGDLLVAYFTTIKWY
jgi:hypothetical protein